MSDKEIKRLQVMTQMEKRQLAQRIDVDQLKVSIRQVKLLWRAYQKQGAVGRLVIKSRGKPSHNQLSVEVKQQALDLILG
ncbi:MAG: hypothetical protein C0401_12335 [Anaerolinea sp.]|nr:hypothetical protein [Anaerolinea sp.]